MYSKIVKSKEWNACCHFNVKFENCFFTPCYVRRWFSSCKIKKIKKSEGKTNWQKSFSGGNWYWKSLKVSRIEENKENVLIIIIFRQIHEIKSDLKISEFSKHFLKNLKEALGSKLVAKIICLGIGRVSECSIAKHQLALLLIIQEELKIETSAFYDPVVLKNDIDILTRLNCKVLSENKEGKYPIEHTTLFYLPHCPKQITNNLLYSNWNCESLQNIILICNSFSKTITSTPERLLRPNAHYLLEIHPFTAETEFENSYKFTDIFNDFSVHSFPKSEISSLSKEFWQSHSEPIYSSEDLEFIKNVCN